MSNDNLQVVPVNGTSLEVYRDRDEVLELTDRLLSLHPEAKSVGKAGMIAVAQLALLVGASPLPGTNEIHVWYNKKQDIVQFQLGINFYRRKAQERGGVLWDIQPRQMRDDEREEYGVPKGMIAAICRGVKAKDMEKYHEMGFPANKIWDMASRTGIGTCRMDEGKVGRTPVWTALKRAEVDIYRALFPTMMQQIHEATSGQSHVKVQTDPGPEWQDFSDDDDMTLDEANYMFFDDPNAPESNGDGADDTAVEGDFEEVDEMPEEEVQPEEEPEDAPEITSTEYLDAAVASVDLKNFAQNVVNAGVGYEKIPHVVQALTKTYAEETGEEFIFPAKDKNKRKALVNWLVDRKADTA